MPPYSTGRSFSITHTLLAPCPPPPSRSTACSSFSPAWWCCPLSSSGSACPVGPALCTSSCVLVLSCGCEGCMCTWPAAAAAHSMPMGGSRGLYSMYCWHLQAAAGACPWLSLFPSQRPLYFILASPPLPTACLPPMLTRSLPSPRPQRPRACPWSACPTSSPATGCGAGSWGRRQRRWAREGAGCVVETGQGRLVQGWRGAW